MDKLERHYHVWIIVEQHDGDETSELEAVGSFSFDRVDQAYTMAGMLGRIGLEIEPLVRPPNEVETERQKGGDAP